MERRNWQMRFHMAAQQAGENERVATGGVMRVIPAIDLKDGRCVRLRQGDMAAETVYSEDVPSVAGRWQQQGADLIHVVDLNGAVDGEPKNLPQIEAVMKTVSVKVQVGGGIRTIETVRRYLHAGVARVVYALDDPTPRARGGAAALRDAGIGEGLPFDRALIDRAEQEIKRQYLSRSLYGAEVVTTVTPLERNRVNVTFTMTEGDAARIADIRIEYNHFIIYRAQFL